MADSTREALAAADAVIARVRARLGETAELPETPDRETADAMRAADEWARRTLSLVAETRLAEHARNFRQRWPALVRWRERVLQDRRKSQRARPADVAAALESLSLECTLAGELELAARVQQQAIRVVTAAVPIVNNEANTAPIAISA